MPNNYQTIQQLIGLWQDYEDVADVHSFENFGKWLFDNHKNLPSILNSEINLSKNDTFSFLEGLEPKQKLMILFSHLVKFQEIYTKKFFIGLPINNLLEFQFLFSINKMNSTKKSDIINLHLIEYTTGIDILKRLIKLNLVEEFIDKIDKRNKRVRITNEGKRILMEALIRMNKLEDLFFNGISENKYKMLIPVLASLNNYHRKIQNLYSESSYFELIDLIV
jgi:DNA-binding MarR family transcriptional regulator